MKSDPCKQDLDRVLLVEGADDCHVVMALCAAHRLAETFGIYECGSDAGVLKRLNALILRPDPPSVIGVLLDADRPSLEGRWQSVQSKLSHYAYRFPEAPASDGTILEGAADLPKIGFWFMPDNQVSGMLEDFCHRLAEARALDFAAACVDKARQDGLSTYKDAHRSKAIIHTYLAWQDEPGRPLGQAITAQALRPATHIAERFARWLGRLFRVPEPVSADGLEG
jgi:hypothetical protein